MNHLIQKIKQQKLRRVGCHYQQSQRGAILPVAIVLLLIMTSLVVTQFNRGRIDQKLAVNTSQALLAQTASNTILRWCEAWALAGGDTGARELGNIVDSDRAQAAWNDAATNHWATKARSAVTSGAQAVELPGVASFSCLYEDATSELFETKLHMDISSEVGAGSGLGQRDPLIRKYRITARIILDSRITTYVQSELRFAI